jgi:filamentous hemagglutinin family protein
VLAGALAALLVAFSPGLSLAAPEGEEVVHGDADFARDGNLTHITTHTQDTIVEWSSFDIAVEEIVQIDQPDETSRILNRVEPTAPTRIDGAVRSNGIVAILNPAGVFVGSTALIDVASLIAGAGNWSDEDFLQGTLRMTELEGAVEIAADAVVQAQESVLLVGRRVANHGNILAPDGMVALVAGNEVLLADVDGRVVIHVETVDAGIGDGYAVAQTGHVDAGQGSVTLTAGDAYSLAINHSGITRARDIELDGGDAGLVVVEGRLDASDTTAGGTGGSVRVLGDRVAVLDAEIDASGDAGGGEVRIGGDLRGGPDLRAARRTYVGSDAVIRADAARKGDGGSVAVWSTEKTGVFGEISARGGAESGDGGFAEISGGRSLESHGTIDLGASAGDVGTLLYDPTDIQIVGGAVPSDGSDSPDTDPGTLASDGGTAGEILFGDVGDGADPFQIFESEIEGTNADIVLEATNSISVSGSFDADDVVVMSGNDLTLRTRNDVGDDTGSSVLPGIDLTGSSAGSALAFETSGGGDIRIETGTGADGGAAQLTVGVLTADGGGDVALAATGDVTLQGAISTGDLVAGPGADASTGSISVTSADGSISGNGNATLTTGDASADGATGDVTATSGSITLQASNGDVTLQADPALVTGDASVTSPDALDAAITGSIDVVEARLLSSGGAGNALQFVQGTADAGADGTATSGVIRAETNGVEAGGIFLGSDAAILLGDLTTAGGQVEVVGEVDIASAAGTTIATTGTPGTDLFQSGDVTIASIDGAIDLQGTIDTHGADGAMGVGDATAGGSVRIRSGGGDVAFTRIVTNGATADPTDGGNGSDAGDVFVNFEAGDAAPLFDGAVSVGDIEATGGDGHAAAVGEPGVETLVGFGGAGGRVQINGAGVTVTGDTIATGGASFGQAVVPIAGVDETVSPTGGVGGRFRVNSTAAITIGGPGAGEEVTIDVSGGTGAGDGGFAIQRDDAFNPVEAIEIATVSQDPDAFPQDVPITVHGDLIARGGMASTGNGGTGGDGGAGGSTLIVTAAGDITHVGRLDTSGGQSQGAGGLPTEQFFLRFDDVGGAAGDVLIFAAEGETSGYDIVAGDIEAVGGEGLTGEGGAGGLVTVQSDAGNVTLASVDASGGDGQGSYTPEPQTEKDPPQGGGDAGSVFALALAGDVTLTADVSAAGGLGADPDVPNGGPGLVLLDAGGNVDSVGTVRLRSDSVSITAAGSVGATGVVEIEGADAGSAAAVVGVGDIAVSLMPGTLEEVEVTQGDAGASTTVRSVTAPDMLQVDGTGPDHTVQMLALAAADPELTYRLDVEPAMPGADGPALHLERGFAATSTGSGIIENVNGRILGVDTGSVAHVAVGTPGTLELAATGITLGSGTGHLSVDADGSVVFDAPVEIEAQAGETVVDVAGDVNFAQTIDTETGAAQGAQLRVDTNGVATFGGDVGTTSALYSLEVDSQQTDGTSIVFESANRVVTGAGGIHLNTLNPRTSVPDIATIADTTGGLKLETAGDFVVGGLEKVSVVGPLDVQAGGAVRVGDLAADTIRIDSPDVVMLGRVPADVLQPDGSFITDEGVDWVANEIVVTSPLTWDGAGGGRATLVLGSGGIFVPNSLVGFEVLRFTEDIDAVTAGSFAGPADEVLDLVGTGPEFVAIPTREIPRLEPGVEPQLAARASDAEPSAARPPSAPELLAFVRCVDAGPACGEADRATFDQLGSPRGALATERAREIADRFERGVTSRDAHARLRATFAVAARRYRESGARGIEGAAFYRFLAQSELHGEARREIDTLAVLFTQVELLGMSDDDTAAARRAIAGDFARAVALPGFDADAILAAAAESPIGPPRV